MRYVIVGCGRMGAGLALALRRGGHDFAFVDDGSGSAEGLEPPLRERLVARQWAPSAVFAGAIGTGPPAAGRRAAHGAVGGPAPSA